MDLNYTLLYLNNSEFVYFDKGGFWRVEHKNNDIVKGPSKKAFDFSNYIYTPFNLNLRYLSIYPDKRNKLYIVDGLADKAVHDQGFRVIDLYTVPEGVTIKSTFICQNDKSIWLQLTDVANRLIGVYLDENFKMTHVKDL
jgi:hypothetical protein